MKHPARSGRTIGMPRRLRLARLLWILAVLSALAVPGVAATAQAAPPESAERMVCLHDRDPAVREAARRELLRLTVQDLSALADSLDEVPDAVLAAPEVEPVLREAVTHAFVRQAKQVFVRQEQANRAARPGFAEAFMGFQLRPSRVVGFVNNPFDLQEGSGGVPVALTLTGFVAYEAFEEGDVLVGIASPGQEPRPVMSFEQLQRVLGEFEPGQRVEVFVLRGGEVVQVSLVLDRRTDAIASVDWNILEQQARQQAARLWAERFAPAFDAAEQAAAQPTASAGQ